MNIWITSDTHFSHTNIAGPGVSQWKSGFRTFDSVHDMNKTLTETINKYVKEGDILYHLGDFCFGGHQKTSVYRRSLNVKTIHLIRGNHDTHIDLYKDEFSSIQDVALIQHGKTKMFMSHYAHRVWNGSHKGVIHLYGHSHSSIEDFGLSMDVGVDVAYKLFGEYRPFHIDEIRQIMQSKTQVVVDHHQ
jgi:calcineurin-like phosphoesterase family protein